MPFNHMRATKFELIFQLSVLVVTLILASIAITEILGRERMIRWATLLWAAASGA